MSLSIDPVRALLTDGQQVELRAATAADESALVLLHESLSERSTYLRFFSVNRGAGADFVHRVLHIQGAFGHVLLAELAGEIVGMASYQTLDTPQSAEVALIVADSAQSRGVGTLLLEHLVSHARRHGIEAFHAEVLADNSRMLRVFADIGLAPRTRRAGTSLVMDIPLRYDESYLDAVGEREGHADVASLTPLLAPTSVAVIGASRRENTVGNSVVRHLLESGFRGPVYPVNPRADTIVGLPAYPSISAVPETPELAVIAVPAHDVPEVAEQCGRSGVRGLVVLSSGLTIQGADSDGRRLLSAVRRYGMRLIGPNCIGVADTDPAVALDATFTRGPVRTGEVGIVTQSGGIGIALLESLATAGLGISTFVSTGDKYDVSSNDLLLWWGRDGRTKVAVVYVESFGNPRKFARLARQLGQQTPVVAVRSASSPEAQRAALSHTAASATPAVTRDALFRQAGIIATDDLQETVDVVTLLGCQELPAGSRVAIISNAGGGGVLAADACGRFGLDVASLSGWDSLRALLPAAASVTNPVDTTAGVDADVFARTIRLVAGDPNVDAVLVIVAPTGLGELESAFDSVTDNIEVPVLGVVLGQAESVRARRSPGPDRAVPVYADPSSALRALGHATRYAQWRRRAPGSLTEIFDLDKDAARAAVDGFLATHPGGGWLDWPAVRALSDAYGIPVAPSLIATDDSAAANALSTLGKACAMKALVADLVHRSDEHAVVVDVRDEQEARATHQRMARRYGDRLDGVLVQEMIPPGQEFLVGVVQDATFGPLVQVGAGGTTTDLLRDRATRLLPLTDRDVAEMLQSLRIAPLLTGFRGSAPLDAAALTDLVHRIARMAQDLPEILEMDLNPVIVHSSGCVVVDIKVRVERVDATDPYLRRLR